MMDKGDAVDALDAVKRQVESLVKSEQEVVDRYEGVFGVTVEEVRSGHYLEAYKRALNCFPAG